MRYRCLILDHDDTVVESTRTIHHPAHIEVMRILRPGIEPLGFDEWMCRNFSPGIMAYFQGELGMNEKEIDEEYRIWRSYSSRRDPPFYEGIEEIIADFTDAGGEVAVVSHSEADIIRRNYRVATDDRFVPELVYGWEQDEERRKPNPWPVVDILSRLGLEPAEALVVDDLKPGVDMARSAGVPVAGAGWGHQIPAIRSYMESNCDHYFPRVADFRAHIFSRA